MCNTLAFLLADGKICALSLACFVLLSVKLRGAGELRREGLNKSGEKDRAKHFEKERGGTDGGD